MNIFKFPFSNLFLKNTHNRFLHSSGRDERKFYFCRMFLDFQKHFYSLVAKTEFQHPKPSPLCDAKLRENEPK